MGSEITIFGGLNEIGGNKILIKESDQAIMFDFGISFSKLGQFFSEFLQPRTVNGLGDYMHFGLLPNIPNLYREDLCKPVKFPSGKPPIDAIFISHAHTDHFGYISFINTDVPVYGSEISNKIIESYETISRGGIEKEFTLIKERPYGQYIHNSKWEEKKRQFFNCKDYKGDFEINFLPVDHSTWGAGMYQINTSDRNIVYTGDLRQHGSRGNLTEASIKVLEDESIDLLIVEGTNVGEDFETNEVNKLIESIMGRKSGKKIESESQLHDHILSILENTDKPIFFDFGLRDFDRLLTFYDIAKKIDRKLIIPVKLAKHIEDLQSILAFDLNDENIGIYFEPMKLGSYDPKEYDIWMRPLYENYTSIKPDELKQNLKDYLIFTDFYHLKNLIDLKPSDGLYIHSSSEPFDEEQAIDFKRHLRWIKLFNLDYEYFHTSGHMNEEDIFKLVEKLNPKSVLPVHTKGLDKFKLKFNNIIIPQIGKSF